MILALLTAWCFAASAVIGTRTSSLLGPAAANLFRLSLAAIVLAAYAFVAGQGFDGPGLWVLMLSGLVGFGLGDSALFEAYKRIGSRRTILLVQCLAVPFAGVVEWLWLGNTIPPAKLVWIACILFGVWLVLHRRVESSPSPLTTTGVVGIVMGVVAAMGQGGGAVLSRRAIELNQAAGFDIDGATAGFQRILPGVIFAALFFGGHQVWRVASSRARAAVGGKRSRILALVAGNALAGPIIGVSLYQWALITTPSGIVLAIVATTPVFVMPLAWFIENDRPSWISLTGSVIAITGVIALLVF